MTKFDLTSIKVIAEQLKPNSVIVELGSLYGRSSACWATYCDPSIKIYCIDSFTYPYSYEVFTENLKEHKNVIPIKTTKSPYTLNFTESEIDLFFLDGEHSNPNDIDNINYFRKLMKPGSIICGHDYSKNFPDVIENVKFLEQEYNTTALLSPSSIWKITVTK